MYQLKITLIAMALMAITFDGCNSMPSGLDFGSAAARNPNGGVDAHVELSKQLGSAGLATVFADGNTKGGPVTTGGQLDVAKNGFGASIAKTNTEGIGSTLTKSAFGTIPINENNIVSGRAFDSRTNLANGINFQKQGGSLAWENANGLGASIAKERIPGVSDTLTRNVHATLFQNDRNKIGANAFDTRTQFANGFNTRTSGGGLGWANAGGHSADLGLTKFHDFGTKGTLGGTANLYTSPSGNTRIGAMAGTSRWLSGPLSGRNDHNFGFGLNSRW